MAILRLLSVINVSKSMLHEVTDVGWSMAIRDNVLAAAYLIVGLGEPRNSCKTVHKNKICCYVKVKITYQTLLVVVPWLLHCLCSPLPWLPHRLPSNVVSHDAMWSQLYCLLHSYVLNNFQENHIMNSLIFFPHFLTLYKLYESTETTTNIKIN